MALPVIEETGKAIFLACAILPPSLTKGCVGSATAQKSLAVSPVSFVHFGAFLVAAAAPEFPGTHVLLTRRKVVWLSGPALSRP